MRSAIGQRICVSYLCGQVSLQICAQMHTKLTKGRCRPIALQLKCVVHVKSKTLQSA